VGVSPARCWGTALWTPLLFAICLVTTPGVWETAAENTAAADPAPAKKSFRDLVTDDEDGRFDVSEMLFAPTRFSFLPVPILITEPAVGYGFGLAPVWFHERPDRNSGQLVPPSVSVLAGFATSDGSRGGVVGHFHSWKHDTWRLLGFAGRVSLDLESAGISTEADGDRSIEYSLDSTLLLLEASRKISARTRLGLRYVYVDSEVGIEGGDGASDRSISGDSAIGGLGIFLGFDSRDNVISPTKGHRFDLRPTYFGEVFGGDADYLRVDAAYTGYWNRGGPIGVGLRLDADWIEDGAPFYAKPFISLRGVPAAAFLGQEVLSAEPEIDWNLTSRWTLLAFAGVGRATNDFRILGEVDRDIYTGGAGFRYLLARDLGMRAGLDFAWSSEGDQAFYIVVGTPWL
jgi:hypothetical protein